MNLFTPISYVVHLYSMYNTDMYQTFTITFKCVSKLNFKVQHLVTSQTFCNTSYPHCNRNSVFSSHLPIAPKVVAIARWFSGNHVAAVLAGE